MKINMSRLSKADASWFLEKMQKVQAFSVLSNSELMHLISQMRNYEFKSGTTLVNQGESANLFFIVHEGLVEVSVKKFLFRNKKVALLKSGSFFGESVLVSNSKRTATVKALTDTSCYVLLKPSFRFMLQENPLFKESLRTVFSRRKLQLRNA
ncbi:MAG: cyclic nucleotide-binding domain-containing protein [Nitrospinaceae bacterium]|jgi:CRP-like cAMP-binding protein|nr:cyclic nucleotide-binding domain-containing protein [Nitrospina sp.]MBT5376376.1 cyclic nucleotide-binding domain-containing protein [Nitrospinaceae bacterium]MBT5869923.1 cyclic nucleotide-binding domain-containing protein [Nitrospinaceae bacterium]MBT6345155.1 cyclic nucleotide-binding domain-containing protein [Nitrospina sp.]